MGYYLWWTVNEIKFINLRGNVMKTEISNKQLQHINTNNTLTRGRTMKYFSIILIVMVTALIGRSTEQATGWFYDQSTQQGFYMFETITIDGLVVEGDGTSEDGECASSGGCDVIGAFRRGVCSNPVGQGFGETYCTAVLGANWSTEEEICVGWVYADSDGSTTLPLMGKEGESSENQFTYLNNGEIASLKIYDASNGSI